VAERHGLENRWGRKSHVGSNPTPTANSGGVREWQSSGLLSRGPQGLVGSNPTASAPGLTDERGG
jgi:hypothetical protein